MKISEETHRKLKSLVEAQKRERDPWLHDWRDLADYILPRRYATLETSHQRAANTRNPKILDGTATLAANTLSAGMLNGITSPARPWFRLRIPNVDINSSVQKWLDDCTIRMMFVMGESNYYTSMATIYVDLSIFNTAAMVIHEDDDDVFRCYNFALGEYTLGQNEKQQVNRFSYELRWTVEQIVDAFGIENCSLAIKNAYRQGGGRLGDKHDLCCMIEPNVGKAYNLAPIFTYRRIIWEKANSVPGEVLSVEGFREWPCVTPRWQIIGNDAYGNGPSNDALGDIKQLQHETKRKAQGLDKLMSPPMVADLSLKNQPTALLPNGVTYVSGASSVGMRPAYQINLPLGEMTNDIVMVQGRIREHFFNDLFKMISQLNTVRSATEIDARVEEKLILLGPVLERFQGEGLDTSLRRIFKIMLRKGMFLPAPAEVGNKDININYASVLNDAQRAVGAAPVERFVGFLGNIAGAVQEALLVPDWPVLILDYADRLGIPAKDVRTLDEIRAQIEGQQQEQQAAGAAEVIPQLAQGAKTLSEIPVGGAANALSQLVG